MQKSYGVVWREGEHPVSAGKLELLPRGLRLEGRNSLREIPYGGLAEVRVGRTTAERLNGRPSVVLERRTGEPVTIGTVAQPGLVGEIVERVAAFQLGAATGRTAIVIPLQPGSRDAVRELLRGGPPFDPEQVPGLDRHEVFLTSDEAIFVFEASRADALEPLLAQPELWQAAAAWHDHVAGPPRIAEDAFSWARADDSEGVSYLATPGPGDSEGGDIY